MADVLIPIQIETTADEAAVEREVSATLPGYEIKSVTKLAHPRDPKLVEGRFVDPVSIIGMATLATIGVRLVNHWLKSKERGVQIDLRTQPATISRLANVPAGVMVIIDANGKASVHREAYDKPEDIIPSLQKILAPAATT